MRKRILIIGASVIVLLGIAAVVSWLVFGGSSQLTTVSDDPFSGIDSDLAGVDILPDADSGAGVEVAPRLIRVTDRPVAEGVIALEHVSTTTVPAPVPTLDPAATSTPVAPPAPTETVVRETEVRFIDRASGNIYSYLAHERSLTRLSNKTLPGIQRASWLEDGSRAYVQFLSGEGGAEYVATYVLPQDGEGGFFLEQNLSVSEGVGSDTLFTLLSGTTGSVGSVANADGTGARTLFTSLLSSLVVHPTSGNYFGSTRASALLDGYAFQISASSGAFTRILGPLRGLSINPNPDGTLVLYSYIDRGTLRLGVLDVAARTTTGLPVTTLAEKCVWADNENAYCGVPTSFPQFIPDNWYQGAASFTDRLWKISMEERLATLVIDPLEAGDARIDAVALAVDPAEDVLFFTDRRTGSLWAYDL